nr:RNA cytidine acetyltransferase 1-like isoform X2 [Tanacetum cinerariifolium]
MLCNQNYVTDEHLILLKPLATGDTEVNGSDELGFFGPYYRGAWLVLIDEFVEHMYSEGRSLKWYQHVILQHQFNVKDYDNEVDDQANLVVDLDR